MKRLFCTLLLCAAASVPCAASEIPAVYDITASSTLSGGGYDSWNLWDYDTSTAWVEGVPGNGIGEYVTFTVPEGTVITGGVIRPGYTKSYDLFFKNAAPQMMRFEVDMDARSLDLSDYVWNYNDCLGGIDFTFNTPLTSSGSVWAFIDSVRGGNTYEDTCISELRLYGYSSDTNTGTQQNDSDSTEQAAQSLCSMLSSFYSWYVAAGYGGSSGPVYTDLGVEDLTPGQRAFMLYWYQYHMDDPRISPYDQENNMITRPLMEQIQRELFGEAQDSVWLEYTAHYADYQSGDIWLSPSTGDFGDAGPFYFAEPDYTYREQDAGDMSGPLMVYHSSSGTYEVSGRYRIWYTKNGTAGSGTAPAIKFLELIVEPDAGPSSDTGYTSDPGYGTDTVYTLDELREKALNYCEIELGYRPSYADASYDDNGMISLHLYDIGEFSTFTTAWLSVNEYGVGHDAIMGGEIDLRNY